MYICNNFFEIATASPKGSLAMTDFRVLFFCPCEPERHRRSGVAIYIFVLLKDEIATGSPTESPRNDRDYDF